MANKGTGKLLLVLSEDLLFNRSIALLPPFSRRLMSASTYMQTACIICGRGHEADVCGCDRVSIAMYHASYMWAWPLTVLGDEDLQDTVMSSLCCQVEWRQAL